MVKRVNRKFRKLTVEQRIQALVDSQHIAASEKAKWLSHVQTLCVKDAERMIENVVGVFGLPHGVAINFPLNGKVYLVPMVLEEPSVVAALSYAALMAEKSGGFIARAASSEIYGQVQLISIQNIPEAETKICQQKERIIETANRLIPRMLARGGGVKDVNTHTVVGKNSGEPMLVVHLSIDTCDAMGANVVNSLCEAIAPLLEEISQGTALLKILSNLADRALVHAEVSFDPSQLATKGRLDSPGMPGDVVRDRMVLASDFALADPYRAATHNKGIMNGIDPLAIATGNDWRSIEACAHAYASRDGQYRALSEWKTDEAGRLCGSIDCPIKVGTVGASLQTNPAVGVNLSLLGIESSRELAELMAAVGLAQNFAALRALCSDGIQHGHMRLHARNVALTADTPDALFDRVVDALIAENRIKVWRAKELIVEFQQAAMS